MLSSSANFCYLHPFGPILGWFTDHGLLRLHLPLPDRSETGSDAHVVDNAMTRACAAALARYFDGHAENFSDVPLDLTRASEFQRQVWRAACEIPYGATSTYGALAERIGRDKGAARAVGHALGQNPIAIIIPCHRFVAANGNLTGYAAGLDWKRELLRIEHSALC